MKPYKTQFTLWRRLAGGHCFSDITAVQVGLGCNLCNTGKSSWEREVWIPLRSSSIHITALHATQALHQC